MYTHTIYYARRLSRKGYPSVIVTRVHFGKGHRDGQNPRRNVRGMAPWKRGPQARYNGRFATHFHTAVHLGSMRRT